MATNCKTMADVNAGLIGPSDSSDSSTESSDSDDSSSGFSSKAFSKATVAVASTRKKKEVPPLLIDPARLLTFGPAHAGRTQGVARMARMR
jgi:hypothetical protein